MELGLTSNHPCWLTEHASNPRSIGLGCFSYFADRFPVPLKLQVGCTRGLEPRLAKRCLRWRRGIEVLEKGIDCGHLLKK